MRLAMPSRSLLLATAALVGAVLAADTQYQSGDAVRIYASHVGPLANPSETYPWYVLPFCPPRDGDLEAPQGLSDSLSGDRKSNTPYEFKFKQDEADVVVCERELSEEDVVSRSPLLYQGGFASLDRTSSLAPLLTSCPSRIAFQPPSRKSGTASCSSTTFPCGSLLVSWHIGTELRWRSMSLVLHLFVSVSLQARASPRITCLATRRTQSIGFSLTSSSPSV
jgi:Endomembrane protein 70